MFGIFAFKETLKQLINFRNDPLAPMIEGSPVIEKIKWGFKKDYNHYIISKQSKAPYTAETNSNIQNVVIFICTLFLMICFVFKKIRDTIPWNLKIVALSSFLGIVFNAAVCATFSMVANRFQGRIVWLLMFICMIIFECQLKKDKVNGIG
jgi:hypothetical protein